jgi:hypothetical protein
VTVIHAVPAVSAAIEIVEQALLPFDFAHFKVVPRSIPPIKTLPGAAPFRARRGRCLRLAVSFAAENKACSAASRRTSARHSSSANFSNRRPFAQMTAHGFESDGMPFRARPGDANGALHTGGIQASRARGDEIRRRKWRIECAGCQR